MDVGEQVLANIPLLSQIVPKIHEDASSVPLRVQVEQTIMRMCAPSLAQLTSEAITVTPTIPIHTFTIAAQPMLVGKTMMSQATLVGPLLITTHPSKSVNPSGPKVG